MGFTFHPPEINILTEMDGQRSVLHYFSDLLRILTWPVAVPPTWDLSDFRLLDRGKVVQLADMDLSCNKSRK